MGLNLTSFPSDTTFRRIFHRLDFGVLAETFHCWMKHYVEIEPGEWFSIDGKSIKGTVNNSDNPSPNFVSLVSVYSHHQGVVVALEQFENKKQSELKVLQHLLKVLHLEQVVFRDYALHTQKKQLALIIESGNDDVIGVKGNQPQLLQELQRQAGQETPISQFSQMDNTCLTSYSSTI